MTQSGNPEFELFLLTVGKVYLTSIAVISDLYKGMITGTFHIFLVSVKLDDNTKRVLS